MQKQHRFSYIIQEIRQRIIAAWKLLRHGIKLNPSESDVEGDLVIDEPRNKCRGCDILTEWNDDLRQENASLMQRIMELTEPERPQPKEFDKDAKPIRRRTTHREILRRLEQQAFNAVHINKIEPPQSEIK
jgi:hypothetical protein